MFTPSSRTSTDPFQSRQSQAVLTRTTPARDAKETGAGRGDMTAPRQPAPPNPDDWTRECLFDCYND